MNTGITNEFINVSISKLKEDTAKIEKCFNEFTEEDIWKRPNSSSNSVGNIILHLCGNIRQYIISSLGGKEDIRKRDEEFSTRASYHRAELLKMLSSTVNDAITTIKNCGENELVKIHSVQGFEKSGMAIIIQVVEYYSYHTGQIIFWTKLLKDKDLGFYAGMDLNKKNKV